MLVLGGSAQARTAQYVVVIDQSASTAAYGAIAAAGGRVVSMNEVGVATVTSSSAAFAAAVTSRVGRD